MRKHALRPQMSVSLLPGIMRAAIVRVNAVIAVCTPLTLVPRSLAMLLIATFIVVAAKLHRNCASTSGTSIARASATAAAPPAPGCAAAADWPCTIIGVLQRLRAGLQHARGARTYPGS